MSKVKQYAEDTAEKNVDLIISNLKDNQIDFKDTAKIKYSEYRKYYYVRYQFRKC